MNLSTPKNILLQFVLGSVIFGIDLLDYKPTMAQEMLTAQLLQVYNVRTPSHVIRMNTRNYDCKVKNRPIIGKS